MSKRVVDELQTNRHFKRDDLSDLYSVKDIAPASNKCDSEVPSDRVLAVQLIKHKNIIYNYHYHDMLLENNEEENLSVEERELAWNEFKCEKSNGKLQSSPGFRCLQIGNFIIEYYKICTNCVISIIKKNSDPDPNTAPIQSKNIFGFTTEELLDALTIKAHRSSRKLDEEIPKLLRKFHEEMAKSDYTVISHKISIYFAFSIYFTFLLNSYMKSCSQS